MGNSNVFHVTQQPSAMRVDLKYNTVGGFSLVCVKCDNENDVEREYN